jgi:hypothetical protein
MPDDAMPPEDPTTNLTAPQTYFVVYDISGDEREEIFRCGSNNVVNAFKSFYNDTFKGSMKNAILKYKEAKELEKQEAEKAEKQKEETSKESKLKKFLGESERSYLNAVHTVSKLNEDSFDEQEWLEDDDEDEDYGDELSDYEWEVGSALTAVLEENEIEYDEENLPDALRDKIDFILQCMKDGWEPSTCAQELMSDAEFMAEISYDDMDENLDEAKKKKLVGKQYKLDVNKDKKLTSTDFKLLRKGVKSKE